MCTLAEVQSPINSTIVASPHPFVVGVSRVAMVETATSC